MSIFNFLEKMFFGRTEKSGNKICFNYRTEMSLKLKIFFPRNFIFFLKKRKQDFKLHSLLHIFEVCNEVCNKVCNFEVFHKNSIIILI